MGKNKQWYNFLLRDSAVLFKKCNIENWNRNKQVLSDSRDFLKRRGLMSDMKSWSWVGRFVSAWVSWREVLPTAAPCEFWPFVWFIEQLKVRVWLSLPTWEGKGSRVIRFMNPWIYFHTNSVSCGRKALSQKLMQPSRIGIQNIF